MAQILLLVDDTGHTGTANIKADLEGSGHTVTVAAAADYASQNYDLYGLVLYSRIAQAGSYTSGLVSNIRSLLDGGKPVGIGLTDGGVASNDTDVAIVANQVGLTGLGFMSNGAAVNEIEITDNTAGYPTDAFSLGNLQIYTADNFDMVVSSMVGTVLAVSTADHSLGDVGLPSLGIVESGTSYNGGANTTGARCFLYSALYAGQSGYTANGSTLLDNLVSWATASASGDATATPSGVSATGSIGAVQVNLSPTVAVTGVQAAGAIGTATVSTGVNATATPAGVSATGAIGDVAVLLDSTAAVTGVSATGAVGTVTVTGAGDAVVPLTGVAAEGQVGTVAVSFDRVIALSGVAAAGQVGAVTVKLFQWEEAADTTETWTEEGAANDVWTEAPKASGAWSVQ